MPVYIRRQAMLSRLVKDTEGRTVGGPGTRISKIATVAGDGAIAATTGTWNWPFNNARSPTASRACARWLRLAAQLCSFRPTSPGAALCRSAPLSCTLVLSDMSRHWRHRAAFLTRIAARRFTNSLHRCSVTNRTRGGVLIDRDAHR